MTKNSAVNLQISNLSTGFSIAGGTTLRTLTVGGSGNTTLSAQQNTVLSLPNRASDTLIGFGDYSAKGVILVGTGSGTFTPLAVGADTQVLTADSTQSSGVKWAATSGGSGTGGVNSWVDVTGTSQTMAANTGYLADNAGLVTLTLPSSAVQFSVIRIAGYGSGGWKIAQNTGQNIKIGNQTTTTGTAGSLASTNQYDQLELLCVVANTTWVAMSGWGNITVV